MKVDLIIKLLRLKNKDAIYFKNDDELLSVLQNPRIMHGNFILQIFRSKRVKEMIIDPRKVEPYLRTEIYLVELSHNSGEFSIS